MSEALETTGSIFLDCKDEYRTLRQEMLEREGRIYDIAKYGALSVITFLSAYYQFNVDSKVAILFLQSLIFWITLTILENYTRIFIIGTYIEIVLERDSEIHYLKMSRHENEYHKIYYDEYVKSKKPWWVQWWGKLELRLPLIGKRWGRGTQVYSYLILMLFLLSWLTVLSKMNFQVPISDIIILVAVGMSVINILVVIKLWRLHKFREREEEVWKHYYEYKLKKG